MAQGDFGIDAHSAKFYAKLPKLGRISLNAHNSRMHFCSCNRNVILMVNIYASDAETIRACKSLCNQAKVRSTTQFCAMHFALGKMKGVNARSEENTLCITCMGSSKAFNVFFFAEINNSGQEIWLDARFRKLYWFRETTAQRDTVHTQSRKQETFLS